MYTLFTAYLLSIFLTILFLEVDFYHVYQTCLFQIVAVVYSVLYCTVQEFIKNTILLYKQ